MAKYTDEQIKKALELCTNWEAEYCEKCPFDVECENAGDIPLRSAFDLIKRQEAEIERLQGLLSGWKTEAYKPSDNIDNIKSEAIKEFWEDLKKQSFQGCDCAIPDDVVFVEDGDNLVAEIVGESNG